MRRPIVGLLVLSLTAACGSDGGGGVTDTPVTGTLEGEVTAPGGGIPDARINLTGGGGINTNSDGTFSFANLEPGQKTVTITPPEDFELAPGETAAKSVNVTGGGTASVSWSLRLIDTTPRSVEIGLAATSFGDPDVTLPVGSTVTWVNQTSITHTITPNDPSQPGTWEDETISGAGTEFDHTFGTAGTFDYVCKLHAGMTGVVRVH